MTRQQADKILKAFTDISACDGNGESVSIIMHELKEAVDKQVPKKIRHEKYTGDPFSPDEEYRVCPRCEADVTENAGYWDYCPMCGQRIEHGVINDFEWFRSAR